MQGIKPLPIKCEHGKKAKMAKDQGFLGLTTSVLFTAPASHQPFHKFKDVWAHKRGQNQMLPEEINLKKADTVKAFEAEEKTETENLWYGDKTQAEIDNLESQVEDRQTGRVASEKTPRDGSISSFLRTSDHYYTCTGLKSGRAKDCSNCI